MYSEAHLDGQTSQRLEEQTRLLLRIYRAEFTKDPASPATESSRSNMIALRHTINQIYGQAAALEVACDSLSPATDAFSTEEQAG